MFKTVVKKSTLWDTNADHNVDFYNFENCLLCTAPQI